MLIDRIEIAKHREISKNVREDKIGPYIEDAQRLDLKPLLGERLYYELANNATAHSDLLNGGTYSYDGKTYDHPGLKKVLSLFAYARYVMFGSYTDTAFGFVEKSNQDSKSVGDAHKRNIYTENQKAAASYFEDVALFMTRTEYDLWASDCSPSRSRFRISKIS